MKTPLFLSFLALLALPLAASQDSSWQNTEFLPVWPGPGPYPEGVDLVTAYVTIPSTNYQAEVYAVTQEGSGLVLYYRLWDTGEIGFMVVTTKQLAVYVPAPAMALTKVVGVWEDGTVGYPSGTIPEDAHYIYKDGEVVGAYDASLGDGWADTRLMGWTYMAFYPWVYHPYHGWFYAFGQDVYSPWMTLEQYPDWMKPRMDARFAQYGSGSCYGACWLWRSNDPMIYSPYTPYLFPDDNGNIVIPIADSVRFWSQRHGYVRFSEFTYPFAWSDTANGWLWMQNGSLAQLETLTQ